MGPASSALFLSHNQRQVKGMVVHAVLVIILAPGQAASFLSDLNSGMGNRQDPER